MDTNIQSAMMMAQQTPIMTPQSTSNAAKAGAAAKEFESVFITQFLGSMFSSMPVDSEFGGGQGEEMFRSLMIDQYGKQIESRGGFGLAASVKSQLLKHQEAAPAQDAATPVTAP